MFNTGSAAKPTRGTSHREIIVQRPQQTIVHTVSRRRGAGESQPQQSQSVDSKNEKKKKDEETKTENEAEVEDNKVGECAV